jgi:hypothetical protein
MMEIRTPALQHTIDGPGRCMRRSVADAIEALRNAGKLPEEECAEITAAPLRLPNGEMPSMVFVVCRANPSEPLFGVPLPTSARFTGRRPGKECLESFAISRLDGASIDKDGTIELADGTRLHAVNVVPAPLPWELTEIQKRIVYWTIRFIKAEAECYHYGPPAPDLEWLDYGTLYGLELPKLEAIAQYIAEADPTINVSRQTIANALSACGMRRPRSGRLAA